jgi:hypothetical protein
VTRNIALDILKVLLAIMVVGIHTFFLRDINSLAEYLTVNGIFRMAVPIFFLTSGFYFYQALAGDTHARWLKRVLMLYAFWMLFYSYFWFRPTAWSSEEFRRLLLIVFLGYYHLWYVAGVIGAALMMTFMRDWRWPWVTALVILAYGVGTVLQYTVSYRLSNDPAVDRFLADSWTHRNFLFSAFPFFCMGYFINKFDLHRKITLGIAMTAACIGLISLLAESWTNFHNLANDTGFDNMASLILVCPAIFICTLKMNIQGGSKNLSLYSAGIYFVHIFFLLACLRLFDMDGTRLTFLILGLSLIASFFLIKINKRLKVIL